MKTDTLFYRLLQDRPRLLEDLAVLPVPPEAGYTLRAEEIKETAFRLDGLLAPADPAAGHPPVFLEVQFQPDADFYARWFAEIFLYLFRRKATGAWRAVVLYPDRTAETPVPPAYATMLENPWVQRVYLREVLEGLKKAGPLPPSLALIDLILAKPKDTPERAKALVQAPGPEPDWTLDWVQTILVYKFPKLTREEILKMLDLSDPVIRGSRYFRDIYGEGREDGRQQEAAAFALRQLRRRFGSVTPEAEQRIAALPVARLEDLGEALLDFAQPSDLTDWLGRCG